MSNDTRYCLEQLASRAQGISRTIKDIEKLLEGIQVMQEAGGATSVTLTLSGDRRDMDVKLGTHLAGVATVAMREALEKLLAEQHAEGDALVRSGLEASP